MADAVGLNQGIPLAFEVFAYGIEKFLVGAGDDIEDAQTDQFSRIVTQKLDRARIDFHHVSGHVGNQDSIVDAVEQLLVA